MGKPSKRQYMMGLANYVGVSVSTYSPGDGVTRYRFTLEECDYFAASGDNKLGTVLGVSDAITWLEGYRAGREQGIRAVTGS